MMTRSIGGNWMIYGAVDRNATLMLTLEGVRKWLENPTTDLCETVRNWLTGFQRIPGHDTKFAYAVHAKLDEVSRTLQ